ncbi:hypothetical protein DPMN_098269 [Dreissena polymorpha]|uniref:Uncharacterized protein n=1 Tax=Dreissena polymorpha TaxID=45954 RepID=A0A9D4LD94_DREPO|nr:hypothetical protein DPMN_098269 [Dreissena polymorpha]
MASQWERTNYRMFDVSVTPLQCHQCTKAGSHLECDAQPVETCSADKQVWLGTKYIT